MLELIELIGATILASFVIGGVWALIVEFWKA